MRIFRVLLGICALCALNFTFVNTAAAQSKACVSLLVGAGYAAKMRVVSGAFHTDWSDTFPIGKTVCQPLGGVGNGNKFNVEVSAVLGRTKTCTPGEIPRVAASSSSVTFQAWGTTLNVSCEEPEGANAERDAATLSVNPDGQKAAASAGKTD